MSRIGKKIITIPANTTVTVDGGRVTIKGPKGELTRTFRDSVEVKVEGNTVILNPKRNDIATRALWGTYASHLINMMEGVTALFTKKLIIEGIGYRAEVAGADLTLIIGFSHPVKVAIPKELKVTSEKGVITIVGADKETVGEFAATIRSWKKPEPYKGKGIRYEGEVIRRKQGKKSV
ncbi:MAG: 50S ribosomal protein L6 [Candidatus Pacebacteria bacterium]|nr:50S ribosomal protein L6 [Candidatus Paceibacterota bacterium]